jgi:pullulanase/glycogen debranching enzyme
LRRTIGYRSSQDPLARVDEVRDMVKALHRTDIEVILDTVQSSFFSDGNAAAR